MFKRFRLHDEKECPYCQQTCFAPFTDIGVGMMQTGPFVCDACGAIQFSPGEDFSKADPQEYAVGFWRPERPHL